MRRQLYLTCLLGCIAAASPGGVGAATPAHTYVVNTADDALTFGDVAPGDGICDASLEPGAQCTLGAAVIEANASPGLDLIRFDIPGAGPHRYRQTRLTITDPVIIDATTQHGYVGAPLIELDGRATGAADGVTVLASGCTIRGLAIYGYHNDLFNTGGIGIALRAGRSVVEANAIGLATGASAPIGNDLYGVLVDSSDNEITDNAIAGTSGLGGPFFPTGGTGVFVQSGAHNSLLGNRIFANAALGISLGDGQRPTPNDPRDADAGSNERQNFPLLASAEPSGTGAIVSGTLDAGAGSPFLVELYGSPSCDPSGFGEGHRLVGAVTAVGTSGIASFRVATTATVGEAVTATATDAQGNTSEFSPCLRVGDVPPTPAADLTGSFTRIETVCGDADCVLTVIFHVRNEGRAAAAVRSRLRLYLSDDAALDAGDRLLADLGVGALRPGKTRRRASRAALASPRDASGRFVIAAVDATNAVAEGDEADNTVTVGPLP